MADQETSEAPVAGSSPGERIAALRARGAERFDPVAFRCIAALARRAADHRGEARRALDRRLAEALSAYAERFDRAERETRETLARSIARFPEAAEALRRHWDAGDFGGLHRLLARLEGRGGGSPLAGLLADLGRGGASGGAASPGELKSLSHFRGTWSRLRADRQLAHAFTQAPENAGPLNAHFLVLQSLKLMREISPEYLEQFMSYADALLWLDQAETGRSPPRKNTPNGEAGKKRVRPRQSRE